MHNSITWGTNFVQALLERKLAPGSVVMDGTMGNGHDTLFLARLVGPEGKVYSFDIQEAAVKATQRLLIEEGLETRKEIILIHDGHENVLTYIQEPIDAAMFNFGYLPGGDHTIITRPETSILALEGTLDLLKPGGILSLMIYYGHRGGQEEKTALLSCLSALPAKTYIVTKTVYYNQNNHPPMIVMVEKK